MYIHIYVYMNMHMYMHMYMYMEEMRNLRLSWLSNLRLSKAFSPSSPHPQLSGFMMAREGTSSETSASESFFDQGGFGGHFNSSWAFSGWWLSVDNTCGVGFELKRLGASENRGPLI